MRKFIISGIGVVSTAALALGIAGPATAAEAPPGSLVTAVCKNLDTQLAQAQNAITAANMAVSNATNDLGVKAGAYDTAQNNLVTALVNWVKAVDSGGSVDALGIIVGDSVSAFSSKLAAWTNAETALNTAEHNLVMAQRSLAVYQAIDGGLACV